MQVYLVANNVVIKMQKKDGKSQILLIIGPINRDTRPVQSKHHTALIIQFYYSTATGIIPLSYIYGVGDGVIVILIPKLGE